MTAVAGDYNNLDVIDFSMGMVNAIYEMSKKHTEPLFQAKIPSAITELARTLNYYRRVEFVKMIHFNFLGEGT